MVIVVPNGPNFARTFYVIEAGESEEPLSPLFPSRDQADAWADGYEKGRRAQYEQDETYAGRRPAGTRQEEAKP